MLKINHMKELCHLHLFLGLLAWLRTIIHASKLLLSNFTIMDVFIINDWAQYLSNHWNEIFQPISSPIIFFIWILSSYFHEFYCIFWKQRAQNPLQNFLIDTHPKDLGYIWPAPF
jgi:hypothetical protein